MTWLNWLKRLKNRWEYLEAHGSKVVDLKPKVLPSGATIRYPISSWVFGYLLTRRKMKGPRRAWYQTITSINHVSWRIQRLAGIDG